MIEGAAIPAIVGAGVSGSVLARVFAENGFQVHVYEKASKFGGAAQQYNVPFSLDTLSAKTFLDKYMGYVQESEKLFRPYVSWHGACEQLLDHKYIHVLRCAPVYRLSLFHAFYDTDMLFTTARHDMLTDYRFGELEYFGGVPLHTQASLTLYDSYAEYVRRYRFVSLGMNGLYHYKTVEQCVNDALQLAQALLPKNMLADSFLLDRQADRRGTQNDISDKETSIYFSTTKRGVHNGRYA